MNRLTRTAVALAATAVAVTGSLVLPAAAAAAAPPQACADRGFTNGRNVKTSNHFNGGGAYVDAILCWKSMGNGYYYTWTHYYVEDTLADGAGATPRLEWTGTDGKIHYKVPPTDKRDWVYDGTEGRNGVRGYMRADHIKGLFIRACLTNTNSPAHHCGEPM
ncbi:hypothetical protein [Micromonospora sp. KC723]|uniref:hypothetical protein n=1 Tax=Micromonospora sp. KC723 TaxID=2530381 RepID=UPI00104B72C8|nr:hypothetical protein [Micromonospora sp. KC723]TDB75122.1 hypothetical protein E1165_12390 [Micromonospora sp. KC723]